MGRIGRGYGSEWHLLRYLGRHRNALNRAIEQETGARVIDWLDFGFDTDGRDAEWKGVDFLAVTSSSSLKREWAEFWPQSGNPQNWDAVGLLASSDGGDHLLVEAKAHAGELETYCKARGRGSRATICRAFEETIATFGLGTTAKPKSWLGPYYQYCNRLAALYFLRKHRVPARLLFIYFCGEDRMTGRICPACRAEWEDLVLNRMYKHIGFSWQDQQRYGVHKIFLPVRRPSDDQTI